MRRAARAPGAPIGESHFRVPPGLAAASAIGRWPGVDIRGSATGPAATSPAPARSSTARRNVIDRDVPAGPPLPLAGQPAHPPRADSVTPGADVDELAAAVTKPPHGTVEFAGAPASLSSSRLDHEALASQGPGPFRPVAAPDRPLGHDGQCGLPVFREIRMPFATPPGKARKRFLAIHRRQRDIHRGAHGRRYGASLRLIHCWLVTAVVAGQALEAKCNE